MDAKPDSTATHDFDIEDVEYLRHGTGTLLMRMYKPRGDGPFPLLVDVHGGAWCLNDRTTEAVRHRYLASHGVAVAVPDFRGGREGAYPRSVSDINFAVRWAKSHAAKVKSSAEIVGLAGQSSGAQQAMLAAMKPDDPRYAAVELFSDMSNVDASVRCVVMSWPVINPLGRYRFARQELDKPNPPPWPRGIIERHDLYWGSEASMADGSPLLILERGENVRMPPAIWFQSRGDFLHDYKDPSSSFGGGEASRFAEAYRTAGGEITLEYFDGPASTGHTPDLTQCGAIFPKMVAFVAKHLRVEGS